MNVTDKKTQRWPSAIDHSSIQKTLLIPRPLQTNVKCAVMQSTAKDANWEEVFKDLNFSLYESKELVNNPTILSMNQSN